MTIRPEDLDDMFGKVVFQERSAALLDHLSSLKRRRGEESIHDTRVQSRRMRAALECFKDLFPARSWKSFYGSVRQITKTLGKARENEVILKLLKDLDKNGNMAENLCREYLEEKCQKALARLLRRLKKKLQALDVRHLRSQTRLLLSELSTAEDRTDAPDLSSGGEPTDREIPKGPHLQVLQPPGFRMAVTRGRRVLEELAIPILSFRARSSFRRATDTRLHELRISAKKLRYTMEIFDHVWPGGLKKEIALARTLQDTGGNYHDWCVLRDYLQSEIRRLTKQKTTYLALQMGRLLADVEDHRPELRKKFLPALTQFQTALRSLLRKPEAARPGDSIEWRQTAEG